MARREDNSYRVAVGGEPADRAVAPLRSDLLISPQFFYGRLCFVIKDPVTLRYYRLQPLEHFLATQLDGVKTARDLLGLVQQRFAESQLVLSEVLQFVGMLHESHLLCGRGPAHARWLAEDRSKSRRRRWGQWAQNFLFLKMPLVNPDRFLGALHRAVGKLIFHGATAMGAIFLILLALAMVLSHTDRLMNVPYSLLSWQNLAILYGVFIVTKVFHEIGHGLATKHFGGEVSNMGVMLFVLTPSFYCDTSDAWMIPSRPARLWINAAGIVAELVIAAAAAVVWMYTPDASLTNQIALNTMISCSVATLFFNANPLLKYDGYYFLADLLEIPNLSSRGRELLGYFVQKYLLGLDRPGPADGRRGGLLAAYCVASVIYQFWVMAAVVGLLYYFFAQHGMEAMGVLGAGVFVVLTILLPIGRSIAFLWKQRWDMGRRLVWTGGVAAVGALALTVVSLLPWTRTVRQPLVIVSENDRPVFVQTAGTVSEISVAVGQHVAAGQVMARLESPELSAELAQTRARRGQAELDVNAARAAGNAAAVAAAQAAVESLDQQMAMLAQRHAELVLRAPADGIVMNDEPLGRVAGCYLPAGTGFCRIVARDHLQARLTIPEQTAAAVAPGMAVRLRLWSRPDEAIGAAVSRVTGTVNDELEHPALAASVSGDVAVTADARGRVTAAQRRMTVIVNLPDDPANLADGMTGRGEITIERTTVAGHLWRLLLESTTADWRL